MDVLSGRFITRAPIHREALTICQFSPDGRKLITSSRDNSARIWDVPSGKPVTDFLAHEGVVNMGAISPDGQLAVTASKDQTARLWDATTGLPVSDSLKHADSVTYCEFSPDNKRVLTVAGLTVSLWDSRTGKPLRKPLQHEDTVTSAHFSPDGHSIVTSSVDGTARILSIPPVALPVPEWALEFAETLGGEKIDERGHTTRVPLEKVSRLQESISTRQGEDYYTVQIKRLLGN
jgi:WD40 repeat protein